MSQYKNPSIGVGVLVYRSDNPLYLNQKNKILMVKRRGVHGNGTWSTPGGYLEFGESFETCACREVLEETGITITEPKFAGMTNDRFPEEDKHFVTIWMQAFYKSGTAIIGSPDESEAVDWFDRKQLPQPLFIPMWNFLHGFRYQ